ncbi:MAG: Spy/CpxP family protein refolding chaperone [Acidobacteriota bacterium]
MNRFSRLFVSASIGLAGLAAATLAQNASGPASPRGGMRGGHRLRHFEKCLSSVNLTADQQSAVQAIQSESKAAHQADFAAMKAAREKLQADRANGADAAVLGQDVQDQDATAAKVKTDMKATHDLIMAKLNPDQQNALATCAQQHRGSADAIQNDQQ